MLLRKLCLVAIWLFSWSPSIALGYFDQGNPSPSSISYNNDKTSYSSDADKPASSSKVRKELYANPGFNSETGQKVDELVQQCLRAVNNCTNTQDTLMIHVALFLLSDRRWRPSSTTDPQATYVQRGCEKYQEFITCVESHTDTSLNSQECFELSGFADSFGFRWHRCNRFKRWVGMKKMHRRSHNRNRYYFRRNHGRMRI